MGIKKDKEVIILSHKIDRYKKKIKTLKKFGISEKKITNLEKKQARYETWLVEVAEKGDYK
jgi:hypothetical protein